MTWRKAAGGAAGVALVIALLYLEYDLLRNWGEREAEVILLQVQQVLALSTVVIVVLVVHAWRRMKAERRELERRLEAETRAREALELALLDPLTGLANRRHFDAIFRAAAERPHASHHALMLLDLNGFKEINDTWGHPVGDEVLKVVAVRIQSGVKRDDVVSRLGGDEFSVVIYNVRNAEDVVIVARRIVALIAQPIAVGPRTVAVTASLGFTLFPREGAKAAEVFARADRALYEAKARKPDPEPVEG